LIQLRPVGTDRSIKTVEQVEKAGIRSDFVNPATITKFFQQGKVTRRIMALFFGGWTISVIALGLFLTPFGGGIVFALCVLWGLGMVAMVFLAANYWQSRILAMMDFPTVHANADVLRRGDTLTLRYRHIFKQDTTIELLRFQLVLREWVRYTQGTSTYTDTRDIVMDEDWHEMLDVHEGLSIDREVQLRVPDDAMHTWSMSDNKLSWLLKLEVDLPGWLDFQEHYELKVIPEVAEDVQ
jgi:hypothetical protein